MDPQTWRTLCYPCARARTTLPSSNPAMQCSSSGCWRRTSRWATCTTRFRVPSETSCRCAAVVPPPICAAPWHRELHRIFCLLAAPPRNFAFVCLYAWHACCNVAGLLAAALICSGSGLTANVGLRAGAAERGGITPVAGGRAGSTEAGERRSQDQGNAASQGRTPAPHVGARGV